MATFGLNPDGTLTPCRAKPENRGRGRCTHESHRDLSAEESTAEALRLHNEAALASTYGTLASVRAAATNDETGVSLSSLEFSAATEGLANAFPHDSWSMLRTFTLEFSSLLEEEERLNRTKTEAKESIQAYLESESGMAPRIRAYLGPDMAPATFAALIVNEVRAMSSHIGLRNKGGGDSMTRIVLSAVANDMTKKRYLASVLFFAGRCCYCSTPLSKDPGPQQATGEHLTPLNPDDPESPVGVTRYGNMALACRRCNDDRGSQELTSWLAKTKTVKAENKNVTLARINAFRDFALYEEYSLEQSKLLKDRVDELRRYRQSLPRNRGVHPPEVFSELHNRVKDAIYELREKLKT